MALASPPAGGGGQGGFLCIFVLAMFLGNSLHISLNRIGKPRPPAAFSRYYSNDAAVARLKPIESNFNSKGTNFQSITTKSLVQID